MPIFDAQGRPMEVAKPEDQKKVRTSMEHLPSPNVQMMEEGIGQQVQNLCGGLVQLNPINALTVISQSLAVLFNSINFPSIDEKVKAETMWRAILENGLKNGDDFDHPRPALTGNPLLSPMTH